MKMGRISSRREIKGGSLNPQHEKLRRRVEGKTEGGCGMGDHAGGSGSGGLEGQDEDRRNQ